MDCLAITRYYVRQSALLYTKISSPNKYSGEVIWVNGIKLLNCNDKLRLDDTSYPELRLNSKIIKNRYRLLDFRMIAGVELLP